MIDPKREKENKVIPFTQRKNKDSSSGFVRAGSVLGNANKADFQAFLARAKQRNARRREEGYVNPFNNDYSTSPKNYTCPTCLHEVNPDSPGYLGYDQRLKRPIPCPECYPIYKARRDRRTSDALIETLVTLNKFPNRFNIPSGKLSLKLETYPETGDMDALRLFEQFITGRIRELFVSGEPGTGKTGLAIGAAQELIDQGVQVLFLPMTDYINLLLENNTSDFDNNIKTIAMLVDTLIIDDMGVERSNESGFTVRETQELIDKRHDENKRTLITSNLTLDGLAEHWHLQKGDRTGFQDAKRLISRMQPWKWHKMTGPDLRRGY